MRGWVGRLSSDPALAFSDWEPYCQSPRGVIAFTRFVRTRPELPPQLAAARLRLRRHVPDERDTASTARVFNGPRYCLRRVVREVRRRGEQPGCALTFGPSDYRTYLVTNGAEPVWARHAGLRSFRRARDWVAKFDGAADTNPFFRNSFGVNVFVSVRDGRGRRVLLFRERSDVCAVRRRTTVGSADEGLRRRYQDQLFDERSATDPSPDIVRCARRAAMEEVGLGLDDVDRSSPMLLSVGIVRSVAQPAALFYWPLPMTRGELEVRLQAAADRHLEFGAHHFVPLEPDAIAAFVRQQERVAPVESWVAAAAMYAAGAEPPPSVFLAYAHEDARRAASLRGALSRVGARVWHDEEFLRVGDDWKARVEDRMRQVDCVVVAVSRNAVRSEHVDWEVRRARLIAKGRKVSNFVQFAYLDPEPRVRTPRSWRTVDDTQVFVDLSVRRRRSERLEHLMDAVRASAVR